MTETEMPAAHPSQPPQPTAPKKNSALFISLLCNIILPTLILNKLSKNPDIGPITSLFLALIFPFGYGLYEYFIEKKKSILSIIGIVAIALTGGLALLKLQGIWFAVKEAAIPLVIGLYVLYSAFTPKPLIQILLFNEGVLKLDQIQARLKEFDQERAFLKLLKLGTILMSGSFFLSALLNFILAKIIFIPIDSALTEGQQQIILNEQLAQMNWQSYFVIAIPTLLVTFAIIMWILKSLSKLLGLSLSEFLEGKS